jgi:hypothetical protein
VFDKSQIIDGGACAAAPQLPTVRRTGSKPARQIFLSTENVWLFGFVALLFACQIALIIEVLAPLRIIFRTGAVAASIVLLIVLRGHAVNHPARFWCFAVVAVLVFEGFHPLGNSPFAIVGQIGLYVSVLAPIFWVCRLKLNLGDFRRLLLFIWGFHFVSACFGVLQVYDPDRFQPKLSALIQQQGGSDPEGYLNSLRIQLEDGRRVFRPMGLTDAPGGAANSGRYAALFGLAFFLNDRRTWFRVLSCLSIALGFFCLYLCQVRMALVMSFICAAAFLVFLFLRGDTRRGILGVIVLSTAAVLALFWSLAVAGTAVSARLETLTEGRPDEVYYNNRGHFLEDTFAYALPEFPLGAGLGRWGMMNYYFGSDMIPGSTRLWVEIQWTGWVFDGGIPLMLAYCLAIGAAMVTAARLALSRRTDEVPYWATLVFGYNVGAIAITFSYPLFVSQSGLEFWLINGALFTAATGSVSRSVVQRRRIAT